MFTLIELKPRPCEPFDPLIEICRCNISLEEAITYSFKPDVGTCYLIDLNDGNVFSVCDGIIKSKRIYKQELKKSYLSDYESITKGDK